MSESASAKDLLLELIRRVPEEEGDDFFHMWLDAEEDEYGHLVSPSVPETWFCVRRIPDGTIVYSVNDLGSVGPTHVLLPDDCTYNSDEHPEETARVLGWND